ncbi:MAG: type I-E CRISPR-associated protein Cse2/CasB [Solirubrobacteraceae bacterium]
MTSTARPSPFIRDAVADALHEQLVRLDRAAERHDSNALRSLASLRRGGGRPFGDRDASPELMRLVGRHIDLESPFRMSDEISRTLDDALVVAALVAQGRPYVRRAKRGGGSLGRDLRALTTVRRPENVEDLLGLLLGASRDELPRHLRRTVALLGAHRLGLDVAQLVRDLGAWDRDDHEVQRRWAFHFWVPAGTGDPRASDAGDPSGGLADHDPMTTTDPTTETDQEPA